MTKKIEDQNLIPHYPTDVIQWHPYYMGIKNPAGGDRIQLAGDITLKNQYKFLDDRDRFARRNLNPADNMEELLNELDQYPENVWNIEWLQHNDPKIDALELEEYYDFNSGHQVPGSELYNSGITMTPNMFPWNTRGAYEWSRDQLLMSDFGGSDLGYTLNYQPSISNIQPWLKSQGEDGKKYKSREFTLNDIPYFCLLYTSDAADE